MQTSRKPQAIYILTPLRRVLLEKLTGPQLVMKFPTFCRTQMFNNTFISTATFLYTETDQSSACLSTSLRSILILSSHTCLRILSGLFPSGLPTKTRDVPLLSPKYATCPAYLILLDLITRMRFGEYRAYSFSLCSLCHSLVT